MCNCKDDERVGEVRFLNAYLEIAKCYINDQFLEKFGLRYTCNVWNPLVNEGEHNMRCLVIRNTKLDLDIAIIRVSKEKNNHVVLKYYLENIKQLNDVEASKIKNFLFFLSEKCCLPVE